MSQEIIQNVLSLLQTRPLIFVDPEMVNERTIKVTAMETDPDVFMPICPRKVVITLSENVSN
jgi:hypothetical protein